jgi:hypothetical protein
MHYGLLLGNFKIHKKMKKLFILLAGTAFTAGFGQEEITSQANSVPSVSSLEPNEMILEQIEFGTSGIVSDSQLDGAYVASADDFDLTYDFTKITKLSVFGFSNTSDLDVTLTGVTFYIIADDEWIPAGNDPSIDADYTYAMAMGDTGFEFIDNGDSSYEFTLDLTALGEDLILPAGKYWLSVVANSDVDMFVTAPGRWNWYQSLTANGSGSFLIDPFDLFGAGATQWTDIAGLTGWTQSDLAMRIEGEEVILGTSDVNATQMSIYPNPANDVLNVSLKNTEIQSVSVSNLSGQVVATAKSANSINVSALPAGVYVVKVLDNKGTTHVSKVVVK